MSLRDCPFVHIKQNRFLSFLENSSPLLRRSGEADARKMKTTTAMLECGGRGAEDTRNHAITCHVKKLQSELLNYLRRRFCAASLSVKARTLRHPKERDGAAIHWQVWIITFRWSSDGWEKASGFIFFSHPARPDTWMIMAVNGAVMNRGIVTFASR